MGRFSSPHGHLRVRTKKRKIAAGKNKGEPKAEGADGTGRGAEMEVAPIPEEFMSAVPVVSLSTSSVREKGGAQEGGGRRTQVLKKRDKRKLRHLTWIQKMEGCKLARDMAKAAMERKKTVVVGDMEPLAAALPQLPALPVSGPTRSKQELGGVKTQKSRISRRANVVREVEHFQKVLEHPAFKSGPLDAISQHIRNSVAQESAR